MRRRSSRSLFQSGLVWTVLALLTCLHALATAGQPQVKLVRTLRVGDNVEDITYVASGAHQGQVAAMDGWDVLGVRLRSEEGEQDDGEGAGSGKLPPGVHRLFDVRRLGFGTAPPRGIEFVPTQRRFYFASPNQEDTERLFVTDENGHALPPLPLTYPAGVDPATMIFQFEALGYIPASSAAFPDHLLAITIRLPDFNGVIEIIRFDRAGGQIVGGTVVGEVAFDPVLPDGVTPNPLYSYLTGVQYVGNPDRLIVTPQQSLGNEVWVVNFDGTFDGPVATLSDANDVESLASLPDGRIALTDYYRATLTFLEPDFTRQPEERTFSAGIGANQPVGIAWNPATQEFLARVEGFNTPPSHSLVAFTPESRSARRLANLDDDPRIFGGSGPAFLPAGGAVPARIAIASFSRSRGIFFYDTQGNYLARISTGGVVQPSILSRPFSLAALPGGQFAYTNNAIFPILEVIAPDGPDLRPPVDPTAVLARPLGQITLDAGATPRHPAQVGGGLSFIPLGSGLLLSGNSLYDLGGNRIAQFDPADLGLNDVGPGTLITTGKFAGDFAVIEQQSSTVAIFRWEPFRSR